MTPLSLIACLTLILSTSGHSADPKSNNNNYQPSNQSYKKKVPLTKKGFGLGRSYHTAKQLKSLGVSWYYDWTNKEGKKNVCDVTYVPMIKHPKDCLDEVTSSEYVLGYNEPDCPNDAARIDEGAKKWKNVVKKAKYVGSPSMCRMVGSWLKKFMSSKPKVDFITLHWYGGIQASDFIKYVEKNYKLYKRPIWVTEYAPQYIRKAKVNPKQYSIQQVKKFVLETAAWMEKTSYVHRYAYHDARVGNTRLFNEYGLTEVGKAYRNINSKRIY